MIDADTKRALFVNQAYETITGRSCDSLRDSPSSYEELIHPEDRIHVLTKLDEATRNGQFNERFRIVRPRNEVRWVWVRGFPVRDAGGKIRRLVGNCPGNHRAERSRRTGRNQSCYGEISMG